MKHKFRIITRIRIWFYWHFGGIVIDGTRVHPAFKPERVKNKVWYSKYEYFCSAVKEQLITEKHGEAHLMQMTIAEFKNTVI